MDASTALIYFLPTTVVVIGYCRRRWTIPITVVRVKLPERFRLDWCQGCGCRHRRQWMRFTDSGAYRCIVCCREREI